jgi:hypothetical protein
MARYGLGIYNSGFTYGESDPAQLKYDAQLKAIQVDYKTVKLYWQAVTTSSGDYPITHWKIIKSANGYPDNPNDGITLTSTNSKGSLLDSESAPTTRGNVPSGSCTDVETSFLAGTPVTYSFWVFNGLDWIFCGSADTVVVEDDNDTTYKLMRLLPAAWVDADYTTWNAKTTEQKQAALVASPETTSDLHKFISGFGFYVDKLRTEISLVLNLSDYRKYPTSMLGYGVTDRGLSYEPTLGDNYHRALYKNGHLITSLKGSKLGLDLFISSLTHFKNTVSLGNNLLLDYNQASFEENISCWNTTIDSSKTITNTQVILDGTNYKAVITSAAHGFSVGNTVSVNVPWNDNKSNYSNLYNGTWVITNTTTDTFSYIVKSYKVVASTTNSGTALKSGLVSKLFTNSVSDIGYALVAPSTEDITLSLSSTDYPVRALGYGLLTSVNTSDITLYSYGTSYPSTVNQTVPVVAGKSYYFYGFVRKHTSNSGTSTIKAAIRWFNKLGVEVYTTGSTPTYSATVTTTTSWLKFSSSTTDTAIVAPAGAVYAGVSIVISGHGATDRFFFDKFSFGVFPGLNGDSTYGVGENIYEDPRTVNVTLYGERVNFINNPGFDNDTGGWITNNASSFVTDTTTSVFNSTSGKLIASANNASIVSNWISLEPSTYYTFSIYVKSSSAATATASIEFSSPQSAYDQQTLLSDANGSYFNTTHAVTNSSAVNINGTSFTRINVTALSPDPIDGGSLLGKVYVTVSTSAAGPYWFDGALLEKGRKLYPYFQGDGGPTIARASALQSISGANTFIIDPAIGFNPLTDAYVSSGPNVVYDDTVWETRPRTSFVVNPGMSNSAGTAGDITGWTAASTATVSSDSTTFSGMYVLKAVQSNGYQAVQSSSFYYPKKVSNSTSVASFPYGGEAMTISAYVYGPADTYTIGSYNGSATFSVPANTWTRIHVTTTLAKPTVLNANDYIQVSKATAGTWYLDKAQAEFGDYPTSYIDPLASTTKTYTYTVNSSTFTSYVTNTTQTGSGRSYYFPRLNNKKTRLINQLPEYIPLGTPVSIQVGEVTTSIAETPNSILTSSSFESSLRGWSSFNSTTTMSRVVGRGSLFSEVGTLGGSWISCANSTGTQGVVGITSDRVPITPGVVYNFSAAVKITSATYANTVLATLKYYDSTGTSLGSGNWVIVTRAINAAEINRWNYIGQNTIVPPTNAAYVKVDLTMPKNGTSPSYTNTTVLFDRVVLSPA